MTLTFEPDLYKVKVNQLTKCPVTGHFIQESFSIDRHAYQTQPGPLVVGKKLKCLGLLMSVPAMTYEYELIVN